MLDLEDLKTAAYDVNLTHNEVETAQVPYPEHGIITLIMKRTRAWTQNCDQPKYSSKWAWTFIENSNEWRSYDNLYKYPNDIPPSCRKGPLEGYTEWTEYYDTNGGYRYKVFRDDIPVDYDTCWIDPSYLFHHGITSAQVRELGELASRPVVSAEVIHDRPVTPYGDVVFAVPVVNSEVNSPEVVENIQVQGHDPEDWGFASPSGNQFIAGGGNNTKRKSTMRKSSINRKAIRRKSNKRKATRRKVAKRRKTKRKNTRRRRR